MKKIFVFSLLFIATLAITRVAFAQSFDFDITLDPAGSSVIQGESATLSVNAVTLTSSGTTKPSISFTVTNLPSSIAARFSQSSCQPSCSTILTLSTTSATPTGSYSLVVLGAGGGLSRSAVYNLTVNPLPQFDFSVSLTPASASIVAGDSTNVDINISQVSGLVSQSQNVTLSSTNAPSGTTVRFSSSSCKPSCSTTMAITSVSYQVVAGTYPITVMASAGALTRSQVFNLTITSLSNQPSFNFDLSALPNSAIILQGGSATAAINVSYISGTTGNVSLTAAGLPSSANVSFNPSVCKPPCSSSIKITTSKDVQLGSYLVTVLGSSAGISKSADFSLSVRKTLPFLAAPVLVLPANGSRLSTITPVLDWGDVKYAGIYLWDIGGKRGTATVSAAVVPVGVLDYNKTYLWKVRSCLDSSLTFCGSWSKERSFVTPIASNDELIRQLQEQIQAIIVQITKLQQQLLLLQQQGQ